MPQHTNEEPLLLETRFAGIIQFSEVRIVSRNLVPILKLFHPRYLAFWLYLQVREFKVVGPLLRTQ